MDFSNYYITLHILRNVVFYEGFVELVRNGGYVEVRECLRRYLPIFFDMDVITPIRNAPDGN